MPRIRSRRSWGAGRVRAQRHRLTTQSVPVVHHTAGTYGLTEKSSVADEHRALKQIQRDHRARGFTDIGYSHIITPSGRIYCGRGFGFAPAAAQYANAGHYHPCMIGNFDNARPTAAQLKSLRWLIRKFRARTGSRRTAIGHYQANTIANPQSPMNNTACPGKYAKTHVRRLP